MRIAVDWQDPSDIGLAWSTDDESGPLLPGVQMDGESAEKLLALLGEKVENADDSAEWDPNEGGVITTSLSLADVQTMVEGVPTWAYRPWSADAVDSKGNVVGRLDDVIVFSQSAGVTGHIECGVTSPEKLRVWAAEFLSTHDEQFEEDRITWANDGEMWTACIAYDSRSGWWDSVAAVAERHFGQGWTVELAAVVAALRDADRHDAADRLADRFPTVHGLRTATRAE